jgi:hypothetical protein
VRLFGFAVDRAWPFLPRAESHLAVARVFALAFGLVVGLAFDVVFCLLLEDSPLRYETRRPSCAKIRVPVRKRCA